MGKRILAVTPARIVVLDAGRASMKEVRVHRRFFRDIQAVGTTAAAA